MKWKEQHNRKLSTQYFLVAGALSKKRLQVSSE